MRSETASAGQPLEYRIGNSFICQLADAAELNNSEAMSARCVRNQMLAQRAREVMSSWTLSRHQSQPYPLAGQSRALERLSCGRLTPYKILASNSRRKCHEQRRAQPPPGRTICRARSLSADRVWGTAPY